MSNRDSNVPGVFTRCADIRWPPGVWHAGVVDSTNAVALRRPSNSFASGAVFWADHQRDGRGRLGRHWQDEPGASLTASLALVDVTDLDALQWFHLGTACAIVETLRTMLGRDVEGLGVKWPNDVVVLTATPPFDYDDPGYRKVAGILTEVQAEPNGAGRQRAALGFGINVNQQLGDFTAELQNRATSLSLLAGGKMFDRRDVLQHVLAGLAWRLRRIEQGDTTAIRNELVKLDVLSGSEVEVQTPTTRLVGTATGFDERARLLLTLRDGTRYELESGDVTRTRPNRRP